MKIAIIGAGAAGLMCACKIGVEHSVIVFDKNDVSGKKLMITGRGRCNVTNLVGVDEFLKSVPRNADFLRKSLEKFTPEDAVRFFERLGVEMHVENGNRVFPVQGGAKTIRKALEEYVISRGVELRFGSAVTDISKVDNKFLVIVNSKSLEFDKVIIATGGVSYQVTGSSGDGYFFARKFGHRVIEVRPSLCGLRFEEQTGIQGTSLTCGVRILDEQMKSLTSLEIGAMVFTKNGVSGPVIHKVVSLFKQDKISGYYICIDFVPNIDEPVFDLKDKPFYAFRKYLPTKVADWLAKRGELPSLIKRVVVPIKDFEDIESATVTRGGVCVSEVDSRSMESKLVLGLFFIGEVLDVDGFSGGFNLQIAFSTGVAGA